MRVKVLTKELEEFGLPCGVWVDAKPHKNGWFIVEYEGEQFYLRDNGHDFMTI